MTCDVASFNGINHVGLRVLRCSQDHLSVRKGERLIPPTEHVGGGNIPPGCIRCPAPVDADALRKDFRRPIFSFWAREVVVEDAYSLFRVYGCYAGLKLLIVKCIEYGQRYELQGCSACSGTWRRCRLLHRLGSLPLQCTNSVELVLINLAI